MIRVNGAFNGFAVPPGEWDVRVYYAPWTWRAGCALAALGLIVLIVMGWRARASRLSLIEVSAGRFAD